MCPWNCFPPKKKQCFMFIPPALRYLVGVLSEKKNYIWSELPCKCWNPLGSVCKCFKFLFKRKLTLFYIACNTFPSFWTLTRVNVLKEAIVNVHTAIISGKKLTFPKFYVLLCIFMRFCFLTTNVLFSISHLLFIIILLKFSVFILGSRNNK